MNRMREGDIFASTHLGALKKKRGESPFTHVLGLADFWKTQIAEYPDIIGQVTTAESMEENARMGKLSAMMTVEEGGVYEGKLENLYTLYDKGVRMSTLTWNFANELGYPNRQSHPGKSPNPGPGQWTYGYWEKLCGGNGENRHSY